MQGYAKANRTEDALDTLKWGTDYLLRTLGKQTKAGQKYPEYNIAYQVPLSFTPRNRLSAKIPQEASVVHVLRDGPILQLV